MAQYFLFVNITKRQFFDPHGLGGGAKFSEWTDPTCGIRPLVGLAILLGDGYEHGAGGPRCEGPLVGSWAGDQIVIAGSKADWWPAWVKSQSGLGSVHDVAFETFENVSAGVLALLEAHEKDLANPPHGGSKGPVH